MASQVEAVRQFLALRPRARMDFSSGAIVVAGGKGGVGTSTISLLLGIAAASRGAETLVVDAAAGAGTLGALANLPPLSGRDAESVTIAKRLTLAMPASVDDSETERRIRYRRVASRFHEYDCVIVDAGSRISSVTMTLVDARELLLVCTSDRICVTATYALYKHARDVVGGIAASVIANRSTPEQSKRAITALRAGSERFLGSTLEIATTVPDDARLAECLNNGALLECAPDTHAFAALQPVAEHAVSQAAPLLFAI